MELYFSQKMGVEDFDGIHLLQDHIGTNFKTPWNGFGFVILFKVYYVKDNKKEKLGNLRVLVKDVEDTSSYFLKNAIKTNDEKIYKINDVMNENVMVSLPTDIDYYKIISNIFPRDQADELLRLLCDASYFIGNNDIYKSWNGFSGALFRDNSSGDALLKTGYSIATGSYNINRRITFTADNFIDTIEPITFSFDNEVSFLREDVNLLIGKNGVGKTSLLGYIADSILGLNSNDTFPYFNKLLVVAYSPFESFKTELDIVKSRESKYKSNNNRFSLGRKLQGVNDYTYIGFKNKSGVFDLTWPKEYAANSIVNIIKYDNENFWWQDEEKNSRFKLLIETLSLAINFDSFRLWTDSGEEVILNKDSKEKRKILKKIDSKKGFEIIRQGKPIHLSSGQLMYAYMIPAIVSEMKDESLLILDEPELYLHPTLEMGLIKMLKSLLKDSSSYAIIATHSAVMAREVVRSGVKILREKAGVTKNDMPRIETYGESLDAIVGEVFDDYFQDRPYEIELEELLKKEDLNEVLDKYSENLGDEALAYLTSKLPYKNDENEDDEYIKMEPI